jgi:hypothetical protein
MRCFGWEALKKDWAKDLPEKRVLEPIHCGLSDKQRKHYREMTEEFITVLEGGKEVTAAMVATQMNKLQQISSGFIYDEQRKEHVIEPTPPKLKAMKEIIANNPRNKFIVFYAYKPSFDILFQALAEFGPVVMAGKDKMKQLGLNFEEQKQAFNTVDHHQVALCNEASSKYGLTLLGTRDRPCHNVFYYENIYDLNARIQSEDRPHRHGQRFVVDYQDFVSSPVELAAIEALTARREMTGGVMLKAFRSALKATMNTV